MTPKAKTQSTRPAQVRDARSARILGVFATRVTSRGVRGNERPSATLGALILTTILALALLAPSASLAAWTRPFLRQITGTPASSFSANGPGGVAVDAEDNLWVGERFTPPFELDKFGFPSDNFVETLEVQGLEPPSVGLTAPESLAIDRTTGSFYATGNNSTNGDTPYVEAFDQTGAFIKRFGPVGRGAQLTVDNSNEATAGSVYVVSRDDGTVSKFGPSGEPVDFSGSASYIKGNQITGVATRSFSNLNTPVGVVVDSHGNIYTTMPEYEHGLGEEDSAVLEYSPSGVFLRAITGQETPGIEGNRDRGGFGGDFRSVAVDPVSGDILVGLTGGGGVGVVDEFDSSGRFLTQIRETSPGHRLGEVLEMAVGSKGELYVSDVRQHAVDVYGPGAFLPSVTLGETTEREPTSVVLNGSVDPEGLALGDCHFEYVTEEAFVQNAKAHEGEGFADLSSGGSAPCVPAAGSIPVDKNNHLVHAALVGLASGVTYRYRLLATSEGALGGTNATAPIAFTSPHAPRVDSTTAANLSSTFADLEAEIDPLGADTVYYFQYVDEAHYKPLAENPYEAGVSVPVPTVGIGAGAPTGSVEERVLQHVGGLVPGDTYHFRVVASNELGITDGPNEIFTTLPGAVPGLPDGRAYELVTPPDKAGGSDMFGGIDVNGEIRNHAVGYASGSGDGFVLETKAGFGSFPGSENSAYVFSRAVGGWDNTSLVSPSLGVQAPRYGLSFDPEDLSRVAINDGVGAASGEAGERLMNFVGAPGGPYATLHEDPPFHLSFSTPAPTEVTTIAGASRDLSHVVLASNVHGACPGAEGQEHGELLCEWAGGELKLVNVNSEGLLLSRCGAELGAGDANSARGAVSADGSKMFFTAPSPGAANQGSGCWNTVTEEHAPQLYMRSGGVTTRLSAPEEGVSDPTGQHPVAYVGASEDGSKVFFVTETWLTANHPEGHDRELYEYDTDRGTVTRISAGEVGSPGALAGAEINTVPAVSAQGTAVYFTADGVLVPGASPQKPSKPGEFEEGVVKLYRYDTATSTTAYVATVSTLDYPDDASCPTGGSRVFLVEMALCAAANWYTTPDGRFLLFATSRELTGYSTLAPARCTLPDSQDASNGHCDELYRYDAATGKPPVCVSCDPSGAPPVSNALFTRSALGGPAVGPPRAMSDDGSYVFFDTADALVPQDGNGTLDVYEWHDGHVALISSGKDSSPSFFLGASADGHDVFFGTHARLVPQDIDTEGDIYDARICEPEAGNPCIKPLAEETAQCEGDACHTPPPAPIDATPGSLTFSGTGNLVSELAAPPAAEKTVTKKATKCAKGKKLSHGKCVKTKIKKKAKKAKKAGHDERAKS